MAMNPINTSPQLRQGVIDAFTGAQRREDKPGQAALDGQGGVRPERSGDKAEISETAHRLVELRRTLDEGRAAVEAEPDVRSERLDEVRARLAQGYYNSVEVQAKVAEGVSRVIGGIEEL